jgi:hypothetical protein
MDRLALCIPSAGPCHFDDRSQRRAGVWARVLAELQRQADERGELRGRPCKRPAPADSRPQLRNRQLLRHDRSRRWQVPPGTTSPGADGRRGAAWCRPRVDRQGRHLAGRKVWRVSARKYQFAVTRRASTMTGAVPGPACTALMTMIALRFRKRQEQEGKDRVIAAWRGSSTYLDVVARRTGRIRGRG